MSVYAQRFDGLADAYDRFRPDYPATLFEAVAARAPLSPASPPCAVDVAAGTGISTARLLAATPPDWRVVAVEPGQDMRRYLTQRFAGEARVAVRDGLAEALGLEDASAALMTVCTAFHWFDPQAFFAEAARVLTPGGVLAVIRNTRQSQPVLAAFDAYIAEHSPEERVWDMNRDHQRAILQAAPGFEAYEDLTERWTREMDGPSLVAMYQTRSTVKALEAVRPRDRVAADLLEIYRAHRGDAPVTIDYIASAALLRRAA